MKSHTLHIYRILQWAIFPSLFLIAGTSSALIHFTDIPYVDMLLFLTIIPVILSAHLYKKRWYILASLTAVSLSLLVIFQTGKLSGNSIRTTLVNGAILLIIGEVIFRARKAYLDYQEMTIKEKLAMDLVFEKSPNAMQSLDEHGNILSINAMWSELFGYSKDEVLGKNFGEFMSTDCRDQFIERFKSVIQNGRIANVEYAMLHKDGTPITIQGDGVVLRDRDGNFERTLCVLRDVTEEKRLKQSLQDEHDKIEVLLKNSADIICALDEDYNIIFVSDRIANQFGSHGDRKCFNMFCGQDEPCGQNCAVDEIIHKGKDFFSYTHNDADDIDAGKITGKAIETRSSAKVIQTEARPFMYKGKRCVLEISRDVTHVHELEEQLHQSAKMEAIGRLAGGVAHDFNNILLAIIGYSELLDKTLDSNPQAKSLVREIKNAGDRAASLTNQLLAFSRKQIISPRILDLNSSITNLDKMLQRLLGEDIIIEKTLDPDTGRILIDLGQIDSMIINLAINARDAMPGGGSFQITTRNVQHSDIEQHQVLVDTDREYVGLFLTDNGTGIETDILEKIFDPFFTTKEQGKGTGLGLSMVYGIMKQNNGFIFVDSHKHQGTTFSLYFPREEEVVEPDVTNDDSLASDELGNGGILVVEDEPQVGEMLKVTLEMQGYTTTLVTSCADAKQAILDCTEGFDLVLSDIVLPDGNGTSLIELDESTDSARNTQWLFMSGYTNDEIIRRNIASDKTNFLGKPFQPDELIERIKTILDDVRHPKPTSVQ